MTGAYAQQIARHGISVERIWWLHLTDGEQAAAQIRGLHKGSNRHFCLRIVCRFDVAASSAQPAKQPQQQWVKRRGWSRLHTAMTDEVSNDRVLSTSRHPVVSPNRADRLFLVNALRRTEANLWCSATMLRNVGPPSADTMAVLAAGGRVEAGRAAASSSAAMTISPSAVATSSNAKKWSWYACW